MELYHDVGREKSFAESLSIGQRLMATAAHASGTREVPDEGAQRRAPKRVSDTGPCTPTAAYAPRRLLSGEADRTKPYLTPKRKAG